MIRLALGCTWFVLFLAPAAAAEASPASPNVALEQQAAVAAAPAPSASLVPRRARFVDAPLSINLMVGGGTPVGEFGFTVEYSIWDRLAAGVGAGVSLGGAQAAFLVRTRPIVFETESTAQGIDVVGALAVGQYTYPFYCGDGGCWNEQAHWAQAGLDYELSHGNFHLATGVGVAVLVGASNVQEIVADGSPGPVPRVYPTAHLTLGVGI